MGSELGMNSPPQSQATILFLSLLFRQHLVYSVRAFLFDLTFFFCLVYCMDGCLLCSTLKMYCAWWKVANVAPNAAPFLFLSLFFFFWMNVHLWYLCKLLLVMWPSFSERYLLRPMAHHVPVPHAQTQSWRCLKLNLQRVFFFFSHFTCRLRRSADTFCISRSIATYLEHFSSQRV